MSKAEKSKTTGYLLWQANILWQREMKTALKTVDLTPVQFFLLEAVSESVSDGKNLSQARLAQQAGIDVMMASKVLRTLVTKKFVVRKQQKNDSRSLSLSLSAEGSKLLGKARQMVEKCDDAFFSKLISKRSKFEKNLQGLVS